MSSRTHNRVDKDQRLSEKIENCKSECNSPNISCKMSAGGSAIKLPTFPVSVRVEPVQLVVGAKGDGMCR